MLSDRPSYLPASLLWAEYGKPNSGCRIVYHGLLRPLALLARDIRCAYLAGQESSCELYITGYRSQMARALPHSGVVAKGDIDFIVEQARAFFGYTDDQHKAYVQLYPNRPVPSMLYVWIVPADIHALGTAQTRC